MLRAVHHKAPRLRNEIGCREHSSILLCELRPFRDHLQRPRERGMFSSEVFQIIVVVGFSGVGTGIVSIPGIAH